MAAMLSLVMTARCFATESNDSRRSVDVSTLSLDKARQAYGVAVKDLAVTGEKPGVAGESFSNVVGMHAPASLRINLRGKGVRFKAGAGVSDTGYDLSDKSLTMITMTNGARQFYSNYDLHRFVGFIDKGDTQRPGSVVFVVTGDDKELYRSPMVRGGEAPINIDVDLTGVEVLELKVENGGDGSTGDAVLWISPVIDYEGNKAPEAVDANFGVKGPELDAATARKLQAKIAQLPVWDAAPSTVTGFDWLIEPDKAVAGIYRSADSRSIVVANPMVSRTFRIFPNLATTAMVNHMTGESLLRAVSSEGSVTVNGERHYIGGLEGQPERGYLRPEWLDSLTTLAGSFIVDDFEVTDIRPDINWKRTRWALNTKDATGKEIVFTMRGEKELSGLTMRLHVSVYDNMPVIRKRFEIVNNGTEPVSIDAFSLEHLAFADIDSPSGSRGGFMLPNIHVESDYNCAGSFTERETDITEKWVEDPAYTSQRNYNLETPCILEVAPPYGPEQELAPGATFRSFAVYEMPFDSYDRERKGLFTRRFYRNIAPWTTQNPIFMHLTSTDPDVVKRAVDQCAETGYEMIILSFGSGANAEDDSEANIARTKELADYARSKGIEMGCYALLASRWISDEVDVINPATGKRGGAIFGSSPCLASDWGDDYFRKVSSFIERTGMMCFEHDGSYPGDVCASTSHSGHHGLGDSQWNQYYRITDFYHRLSERGVYLNVPDFYFLNGSTKVGIGYREANWSLPRDRQLIHTRQLNYDCTYERPQSALWSFVPLVEYQGGGAAATLEPLSDHLFEYRTLMFQNYSAGVQACYRGPRLYDTPEVKKTVTETIGWYKKYREILNSDIIHLRRPDGQDWDGIMHVSATAPQRALATIYNPTDSDIERTVTLPLYYSGLKDSAKIREREGKPRKVKLDAGCNATVTVTIPANGYTWLVAE